jgi:hypothetical protein
MKVITISPDEAKALGHQAASVLGQIRYWLYKAKNGANTYVVERFGDRWLAHSREQLGQETGLTSSQMRRAIERLKKHGFIAVEQHLFQGKNVSHFRAANEGHLAENGSIKMAQHVPPEVDSDSHPELDSDDQLIKKEINLEIEGDYGAPNAPMLLGKKNKKNEEEEEEGGGGGETAPFSGEITPSKLSAVFRDAWHDAHPDDYLPEFGAKQMGQFKSLLQRCPVGEAAAVVDHSVRQWGAFCSYAASREGAFNLPTVPNVGSLVRFVQSAVNLYHDDRKWHAKAAAKKHIPPVPEAVN